MFMLVSHALLVLFMFGCCCVCVDCVITAWVVFEFGLTASVSWVFYVGLFC